ncbi:MAG: N-acetylneuraminate synthase family protein [Chloroflexota bacterium]
MLTIQAQHFSPNDTLIIAEIAQAHDGSLGMAHAYIDAVAKTGANAIKFQTHIAAAESTPAEPWRVKFSQQDEWRYDYWRRMEFTPEQWHGLKQHADEAGLIFLSSPFSIEAVELLDDLDMAAWKIASGEVTNWPMLERMAATKRPFLLSSGMSDFAEIDGLVNWLRAQELPFALLQCTSAYPCPPEKVGLNVLSLFQERYQCPVGLSDHSGTIFPSLAAATLGATVLEVHVTMSRGMFGPDVVASVTTDELAQLVAGVRFNEQMQANPVDKDAMRQEMEPLRHLFTKSVALRQDLPAGTLLKKEHLTLKKPGTGFPSSFLPQAVGWVLVHDVPANRLLQPEDLDRNRRSV